MGMSTGSSKDGATPNINVTPLIDVLLVLLITITRKRADLSSIFHAIRR